MNTTFATASNNQVNPTPAGGFTQVEIGNAGVDSNIDPFVMALEMVGSPVFLFSAQGDIIFANIEGSDFVAGFTGNEHYEFSDAVRQSIADMDPDNVEGFGQFGNDRLHLKTLSMGHEHFFSVQVEKAAFSVQDQEDLAFLAYHDELTGLKNYRGYQKAVGALTESGNRRSGRVSLILVDVDNFKKVNDTWGHMFGNWVLEEIGQFLGKAIRRGDQGFRIGGDEFAILSHHATEQQAKAWAARIHQELTAHLHNSTGNTTLSISMGFAQIDTADLDGKQIFEMADATLYKAKENGKSTIVLN